MIFHHLDFKFTFSFKSARVLLIEPEVEWINYLLKSFLSDLWFHWHIFLKDLFNSRKIFSCSKVHVPVLSKKASFLKVLRFIIWAAQFLDLVLPSPFLLQLQINFIIKIPDFLLSQCSILNLTNFSNNLIFEPFPVIFCLK